MVGASTKKERRQIGREIGCFFNVVTYTPRMPQNGEKRVEKERKDSAGERRGNGEKGGQRRERGPFQ